MLPTKRSATRSNKPSDHTKTSWQRSRSANCSGTAMYHDHLASQNPSCKVPWDGEEKEVEKRKGGKTTRKSGQTWSSPAPSLCRTGKDGRRWLQSTSAVPQRSLRVTGNVKRRRSYDSGLDCFVICSIFLSLDRHRTVKAPGFTQNMSQGAVHKWSRVLP